jgi:hypothetical protein
MEEAAFARHYFSSCFNCISTKHSNLLDLALPFEMLQYLMPHLKIVVCSTYLNHLQINFFK